MYLYKRILNFFIKKGGYSVKFLNKRFWDDYAGRLYKQYDNEDKDYAVIREIIQSHNINTCIDFGCGPGRLVPLWEELKSLDKIVLYDISDASLKIASDKLNDNKRYVLKNIFFSIKNNPSNSILISNRVLQHIPPAQVIKYIHHIADVAEYVYINESITQKPGVTKNSFYLYFHDYAGLFSSVSYKLTQQGMIGEQHWYLFKRK